MEQASCQILRWFPPQRELELPVTCVSSEDFVLSCSSIRVAAQTFPAVVDTGSDLIWVQSLPCEDCQGRIFVPELSFSFRRVPCDSSFCKQIYQSQCVFELLQPAGSCQYTYRYGMGVTQGGLAFETLTLDRHDHDGAAGIFKDVAIGTGNSNQGFDGLVGIVGLGRGPLSLISQLFPAIGGVFSYCLVGFSSSEKGLLLFGDDASLKGFQDVESTPFVAKAEYPSFYVLALENVFVGGIPSASANITVVIDSGTTITMLPHNLFSSIKQLFQSQVNRSHEFDGSSIGYDLCYQVSGQDQLPSLELRFQGGATLHPPVENYFMPVDESGNVVCLAIMGVGDGEVSILGNVMQQNYRFSYDTKNGMLSFVKTRCDKL